jgi:tripartite-type tricarboxylate transporter receptor subunit TctC
MHVSAAPGTTGGSTDQLARLVGQRLQDAWGQGVVVDNKPGAGLRLGAEFVAKSPADRYTLLMGAVHHSIAQAIYTRRSYDFQRDLAPISAVAVVPNVVIVPASLPVRNLADLMGGQIQNMFDTVASCLPHIKAGKIRALAVTTGKRSSALPDVPTLDEAGLEGFDVSSWFGLMAPAGSPPDVRQKTYAEVARMLGTPEVRQQLARMGAEPIGNTPDQLRQQIAGEISRLAALAQKARLQLD